MGILGVIMGCGAGEGVVPHVPPRDTAEAPRPLALVFDGPPPKNLLMLSVDTLRRDHVGVHDDGPSLTPFLDELAAESFVLEDLSACSDWTVASTSCVLSGASTVDRAPDRGMIPIVLATVLRPIPADEQMLGDWLGEAGYSSLLVTSNGFFSKATGAAQGYDDVRNPGFLTATGIWNVAKRQIDPDEGGEPLPSPWFLHLHFFEPHRPYVAPEEYILGLEGLPELSFDLSTEQGQNNADQAIAADPRQISAAEVEAIKVEMRLRYEGEVRYFDAQLREIWTELDDRGLLDDTLVVFWTDHGEELWEHGPATHAYLLHRGENDAVAMFWARNLVPGTWTEPTTQTDLAPTVLEVLGVEIPDTVTGVPIGKAPPDRPRFAATDAYAGPVQSVRRGSHLMQFRWRGDEDHVNLELFDLATDPRALTNLYDPAAPSAEVRELWDLLKPEILALEPWVAEDPRDWRIYWPPNLP